MTIPQTIAFVLLVGLIANWQGGAFDTIGKYEFENITYNFDVSYENNKEMTEVTQHVYEARVFNHSDRAIKSVTFRVVYRSHATIVHARNIKFEFDKPILPGKKSGREYVKLGSPDQEIKVRLYLGWGLDNFDTRFINANGELIWDSIIYWVYEIEYVD